MSAVVRRADKERMWAAWAGTKEELRRIGTAVEEEVEARKTAILAAYDAETKQILAGATSADPVTISKRFDMSAEFKEQTRKVLDEQIRKIGRESLSRSLRLEVTLVEGDNTTRAPVDQVIQELDRRETDKLEFSMRNAGERLEVEMRHKGSEWGARLRVSSADTGWANQAYVRLSEEIDKGEPGWSWMRKRFGRAAIALSTALVFIGAIDLALLPSLTKLGTVVLYSLSPGLFALLFVVLWATEGLHTWLLPRFEIVAEGSPSTGGRRLAWIGTMIATLAVGVIVNLITQ